MGTAFLGVYVALIAFMLSIALYMWKQVRRYSSTVHRSAAYTAAVRRRRVMVFAILGAALAVGAVTWVASGVAADGLAAVFLAILVAQVATAVANAEAFRRRQRPNEGTNGPHHA